MSVQRAKLRIAAGVGLLILVALALRLPLLGDALFGDEIYTFELVDRDSLRRTLGLARETEGTPPLFYALAWLTHWIGDPAVSIRLPSLLFGVATVPLTYALGSRLAGPAAGAVAAALVALSPFHVYYSTEARAYALAGFFVVLALLALVSARAGSRRWWIVFALAAAGAAYSHYTTAFPLAAAVLWSAIARPESRRELVLAVGAAAVAYLPWLPFLEGSGAPESIAAVSEFTLESVGSDLARTLTGHPYRPIADLPGEVALAVLGVVVAAAVVLAVRERPGRPELGLVLLAAAAAPVGIAIASIIGDDIFIARNLLVSTLPAFVALGVLCATAGRGGRIAAAAMVTVVAYAGIASLGDDSRRVPTNAAAASVEAFTHPGDPVVHVVLIPTADFLGRDPQVRSLSIYLDPRREAREAELKPASILRAAGAAGRFAVVIPGLPEFPPVPAPALDGYRVAAHHVHPGLAPVSVFLYERAP